MNTLEIKLTDEQNDAIKFARENIHHGIVAISGPAGSGKTTLIKELLEVLPQPVEVAAMTNKARHVLAQKGLTEALTLHQACLRPVFNPPLDELVKYLTTCKNYCIFDCRCECTCRDNFSVSRIGEASGSCKTHGRMGPPIARELGISIDDLRESWQIHKDSGIYAALRHVGIRDVFKYIRTWIAADPQDGVLIIDEASMLGEKELELASQVYSRIVLIGDEAQLPPVQSEPVFWNIETRFALQHIHRQAAGSQPLVLAQRIRDRQSVECGPVEVVDAELCREGMPVIVWRNKTRVDLTMTIRKKLGYENLPPQVGEYLICRNGSDRKGKARGLFNNSIWKVIESRRPYVCTLENDAGDVLENERIFMEELDRGDGIPFRFAYALTAHSAQGSEWPVVMIHEPDAMAYQGFCQGKNPDDLWKWLYTSITRAKDRVMWVGDN